MTFYGYVIAVRRLVKGGAEEEGEEKQGGGYGQNAIPTMQRAEREGKAMTTTFLGEWGQKIRSDLVHTQLSALGFWGTVHIFNFMYTGCATRK